MWVMGVLPSAWIVQLRYQCGLVCAQALHNLLHYAIQLSRMAVRNCLANTQGAPGAKWIWTGVLSIQAARRGHMDTRNSWPYTCLYIVGASCQGPVQLSTRKLRLSVQTYPEPNCKATHCLSMRVATTELYFRGNLYSVLNCTMQSRRHFRSHFRNHVRRILYGG